MKKAISTWKLAGDGLQLGGSIVLAIFIGFGFGYWLDGKFGVFPYLSITGFFMGIAAAVRNLMLEIRKQNRRESTDDTP